MLHSPTLGHLYFHVRGRSCSRRVRAITLIHNAARGYPRAVNNLAVHALTAAFAAKSSIVDEKSARIGVTESGHD